MKRNTKILAHFSLTVPTNVEFEKLNSAGFWLGFSLFFHGKRMREKKIWNSATKVTSYSA